MLPLGISITFFSSLLIIFASTPVGDTLVTAGHRYAAVPRQKRIRSPDSTRDVKKRLDCGGVDTIDSSTSSKNQYEEFTRTLTFTFIDESNLYRGIFQSKKAETTGVLNITEENKAFATLIGDWLMLQILYQLG